MFKRLALLTLVLGCMLEAAMLPAVARQASLPAIDSLVVIGLTNEVKDASWRDARVGMGLRNVLAELFFDTGRFVLLEDQPEIQQRLGALAEAAWALEAKKYDFRSEVDSVRTLASGYVAYGRVFYFGRPRSKVSFGPIHAHSRTVLIRVEVTLEEVKTGERIRERGEGKAKTVAKTAIFSFREQAVELDKTNVGTATRRALREAVEKVMETFAQQHG